MATKKPSPRRPRRKRGQSEFDFDSAGRADRSDPASAPSADLPPGDAADVPAHQAPLHLAGAAPGPLQAMMDDNFLQYASYVICDRAIPAIEDGLKPVQRRILHSLHEKDDGRFTKVANIVGHTMQYHPHGDASITDALVNLASKGYLIEGQGNFGNILTGDSAAASRYIECRLTDLARQELFNDDLTRFAPSYDHRAQEPVALPAKIPVLLMHGADGIAVGLSTRILPHNFSELVAAQVAILKKKPFRLVPDFPHGGLMDVAEYDDGKGSVRLRAKVECRNDRMIIREIPWGTTTESVIASIEDAVRKKKVAIKGITDFTSDRVEIELALAPDADPAKGLKSLYAFTACESKVSSHVVVLKKSRPIELGVSDVLRENTRQLVKTLERELSFRKNRLLEEFHRKTLVQIFVENRLYKRIETCRTYAAVQKAVLDGLKPFRRRLRRDVTKQDVERLLEVRIRRISQFDIEKNRQEIDAILAELKTVEKHLSDVKAYTVRYLQGLIKTYGERFPRRTEVARFEEVELRELTAREISLNYDRDGGYLGHAVEGKTVLTCSSLDKVVVLRRNGKYKVVAPPDKLFADKDLVYCGVHDRDQVMTVVYWQEPFHFIKRFRFGGAILNRDYSCTPDDSRVVLFSAEEPEEIFVKYKPAKRQRIHQQVFRPGEIAVTTAKARGSHLTPKLIDKIATVKPRWWKGRGKGSKGVIV